MLWLLPWLPEGSAFHASIAGGPHFVPWTLSNLLAAAQANALNAANWQRGGGKGKRPNPIEPPKPKKTGKAKRGLRRPGGAGVPAALPIVVPDPPS